MVTRLLRVAAYTAIAVLGYTAAALWLHRHDGEDPEVDER